MYDFDESGVLTLDEMILAYRSALSGAAKICKIDPPLESDIENTVAIGFDSLRKETDTSAFAGIDRESFVFFCLNTPDVVAWIEYFDDLKEYSEGQSLLEPIMLWNGVPKPTDPTEVDEAYMNPSLGGLRLLEVEAKFKPLGNKSWRNVLPFINSAQGGAKTSNKPAKNLLLDWVYGYNAHSSKQNLFYSSKGELIYPAGAVVVLQNVSLNEQRHFNQHYDLVTALVAYNSPEGETIVASGERGFRPFIHVWDAATGTVLSSLVGFHRGGILRLDFSPDRELLASLGNDPYHSIAVYRWRTLERLWSMRTTSFAVHDIRFLANDILASCGQFHVYFWKRTDKNRFKRYRGQGAEFKPEKEIFWCVGNVGDIVYTGNDTGFVQIWEGRNCVRSIKAHTGPIYAAAKIGDNGLVTGCGSGKVLIWSESLDIIASFNVISLGPVASAVFAVNYDSVASKVLLGLQSCEIFEMDASDGRNVHAGGAVVAGHFHPRVCGLSTHPYQSSLICTVGDDKTIRVIDIQARKQVRMCTLDCKAHCVSFSQDGQLLLVGLGSGTPGQEEAKEGAYLILNAEDLTIVHEARDSKQCIADARFTPDGEKYALTSFDGNVYLYQTKKMYAYAICRGHTAPVHRVDFSSNNTYMMTNTTNGELLFWDINNGLIQAPKTMKNVKWESNACPYSFGTQSFWNDTLNPLIDFRVACKTHAEDVIFAVDNLGNLLAADFPCYADVPPAVNYYQGHAKGIMNCQISCDDKTLFTTGETDGCVFQWRLREIELSANIEINLKRLDAIPKALAAEIAFDNKALDRTQQFEDAVNFNMLAVCELEEGVQEPKAMVPWQKSIVAPSKILPEDNTEPPDRLELEYVYGFTQDVNRQSLVYLANHDVAFFLGSVAVLMNPNSRQQRYYREHHAKILSLAVCHEFDVVATGELGRAPRILIWDSNSLTTRVVLHGTHRKGVNHLRFSANGQLLLSAGQDYFHQLVLHDWRNSLVLLAVPTFVQRCMAVDFNPMGNQIVQCGNEKIRFYSLHGRNVSFQDALLTHRSKLQPFTCLGWIGGNVVVGAADGSLYRFLAHNLESIVQAHTGPVNALASSHDGLVSASADGYVKIWTRFLECRLIIDMKAVRAINPHVRTVDWNFAQGKLLLGTAASEIFEVSSADGENVHRAAVLEGHGGDELWGLSVNPTREEFCTVGDDCLLKVWDNLSHTSVTTVTLEMPARCCAYSPDGKHIAVGFGSPRKVFDRQFDGKWIVIDTVDYQVSHEARDSNKWLREIKYSPNGHFIVIGSDDNRIYVYNVQEGYALAAMISQHQSFIVSFDFSDDSLWLRSNCGGLELCYFETETGLYIPAAARLRDVTWATHNCLMEFTSQGIWSIYRDGSDFQAADCNTFRGDDDGQIIVAGDNFGRLKIFRYPCVSSAAVSKAYWVAACPITRVRFASGDNLLVSLAGEDKGIFQWRHLRDRASDAVAFQTGERRGLLQEDHDDLTDWVLAFSLLSVTENLMEELKSLVSVRPWIGAIVEPTNLQEQLHRLDLQSKASSLALSMHHLYGLQSQLARNSNVFYNAAGDLVYGVSRYLVVYSKKMNSQSFYAGHLPNDPGDGPAVVNGTNNGEVCCLAVSLDGKLVASAAKAKRPQIHIWDAVTTQAVAVLPPLHRKGVLSMSFSADRRMLLSVGVDDDHSVALWVSYSGAWHDAKLLAWNRGDVAPVLFAAFYTTTLKDLHFLFATGGRFHVKFWVLDGNTVNPVYAEYGRQIKIGTLLCGAAVGRKFVTGSTVGHLYIWKGRTLDRMIRAHERSVTAIKTISSASNPQTAGTVITTSREGSVKLWTFDFEHLKTFSLAEADIPPLVSTIRGIDALYDSNGLVNTMLAATASGEVYEIYVTSGRIGIISEGHYDGELYGLAVHPTNGDLFLTTGDDCTIRVWSISERRLLRKAVIDCTARCATWSPDGKYVAVGLGGKKDGTRQRKDGAYLILDGESLKPKYEGRDSRHWLTDIKFSPDGKMFATASMDHKIYLYATDTFKLKGTCDKHNGPVQFFDFSLDSIYLQSDSSDYEHLYFEASDGQYFSTGSQLRDIQWADWTCKYGWPVQGIWPQLDSDGKPLAADPACVHRSPNKELLCVGDQKGFLKLHRYPCLSKKVRHVSSLYDRFYRFPPLRPDQVEPLVQKHAHIGEISRTRFTCDGK
jgi:microtubule-associated protein-like 6